MTWLDDVDPIVDRVPMVIVLETSSRMRRPAYDGEVEMRPHIDLLNDGLREFKYFVEQERPMGVATEIGVVSFGPKVTTDQSIAPVNEWSPPTLKSGGTAPLGEAIERGIDLLEERKADYREEGLPCRVPIFGLLISGRSTDMSKDGSMWNRVQKQLELGTRDDHFELVAGGVDDGVVETLCELTAPADCSVLRVMTDENGYEEYFRLLAELAGSVRVHYLEGEEPRMSAVRVEREYTGLSPVECTER